MDADTADEAINRARQSYPDDPMALERTHDPELVTIVVCFRERWRFSVLTIESILANTTCAFSLWLLDSGMPKQVRDALQPHVDAGTLEIVDVGPGTAANDARRLVAGSLTSRYVVFVDNDIIVRPRWLESMIDCAEETGAGIVCPLYLWGDRADSDLIHMAGGELTILEGKNGARMVESHRHGMRRVGDVEDELGRGACDFGEYHCLLMRQEVYSAAGVFDSEIVAVHEHIHASLRARELGYATWLEPEARVTYLAFAPWLADELADLRRRWALDIVERSLQGFARRWNMVDDDRYRDPLRAFVAKHLGRADLLDVRPAIAAKRAQAMTRADLQQTCSGLEWLALRTGYDGSDALTFASAYRIAIELMNGLYRPCGRPFINHLVGTASVLVFYGCAVRVVLAGLFHAAFTHGQTPRSQEADQVVEKYLQTLGPAGEHAVKLAKLYGDRSTLPSASICDAEGPAGLTVEAAELLLLDAANDLDMHLSLEVAFSGRSDVLAGRELSDCLATVDLIGLPGLSTSLQSVRDEDLNLPKVKFNRDFPGSFRLNGGRPVPAMR